MPVYTLSMPSPAYEYDETFPTRCTESFSYALQAQLAAIPVTVYAPTSEELDTFWDGLIESYNALSEYVNQWLVYLVDGEQVPTATLPGISCGAAVKGYPGIMQTVSDFLRLRYKASLIFNQFMVSMQIHAPLDFTSYLSAANGILEEIKDQMVQGVDLVDQIKDQETILNIGDFLVWTKSACVDEEVL